MHFPLWLRLALAYLLWGVFAVACYVVADQLRQAVFGMTLVLSDANSYVVRFVDRVLFVIVGLIWLAVVVWLESVFRQAAQKNTLGESAATTLSIASATLLVACLINMGYAPGAQTQTNVAIRDGALSGLLLGGGALIAYAIRAKSQRRTESETTL